MSYENHGGLHPDLVLGQALPSTETTTTGKHLYVSIADLIMEHIFYHPAYDHASLTDIERSSIDAILGSQSASEHFVSTLVTSISSQISDAYQAIRVSLNNADSLAMRSLLGGGVEETEDNPALGVRGVSRYASLSYNKIFALECDVIKQLQSLGHQIEIVVPFVRTLSDAAKVIDLLAEQGLPRGLNGLKVLYVAEVPAAALLTERLLHYFDGVVINLENLTQYALGVDRHSENLQYLFDPQNEAVLSLLEQVFKTSSSNNKPAILLSTNLAEYPKVQELALEYNNIQVVVTM